MGFLVTILALFGVLTAVLGVKKQSLAEAGALMDGWIAAGVEQGRRLIDQTPEAADVAVERTGDALDAGATATTEAPITE